MRKYVAGVLLWCCFYGYFPFSQVSADEFASKPAAESDLFPEYNLEIFRSTNFLPFLRICGETLWYGTFDGMVRRDIGTGRESMTAFPDGLPSKTIACVEVAPNGDQWVASGGAVARYDGVSWKTFTSADGLTGTAVTDIAAAPDGTVWVGSAGLTGGISRFDGKAWKTYTGADGLVAAQGGYTFGSYCNHIAFGPDGTVWVSATSTSAEGERMNRFFYDNSAVSSFDGTRWTKRGDFHGRNICCLEVGADGKVWTGSEQYMGSGGYISVLDGQTWTDLIPGTFNSTVSSLHLSPEGEAWAMVEGYGLYRSNGSDWKTLAPVPGAPGRIMSITFGPDGAAWCLVRNGISRYSAGAWETIVRREPIPDARVSSLTVDSRGDLWALTDSGVCRYDGTGWTATTIPESQTYFVSLQADHEGAVWAGANNGKGIWRCEGNVWKKMGPETGLNLDPFYFKYMTVGPENTLYVIGNDASGRQKMVINRNGIWTMGDFENTLVGMAVTPAGETWYATSWNLYRYAPGGDKVFTMHRDFPGDTAISAFAVSPKGTAGVLTDAGVFLFDGAEWIACRPDPARLNWLDGIAFDSSGKLWCRAYEGAAVFDGSQWRYLHYFTGLVPGPVSSIAAGGDGTVWIGTVCGITRLTPKSVSVESGPARPKEFTIVDNHPNPFNPSTAISFTLPRSDRAELSIYSVTGQKIRTLLSGPLAAGAHSAVWDGKDDSGMTVSSGIYIAHLRAGKLTASRRMALVK